MSVGESGWRNSICALPWLAKHYTTEGFALKKPASTAVQTSTTLLIGLDTFLLLNSWLKIIWLSSKKSHNISARASYCGVLSSKRFFLSRSFTRGPKTTQIKRFAGRKVAQYFMNLGSIGRFTQFLSSSDNTFLEFSMLLSRSGNFPRVFNITQAWNHRQPFHGNASLSNLDKKKVQKNKIKSTPKSTLTDFFICMKLIFFLVGRTSL